MKIESNASQPGLSLVEISALLALSAVAITPIVSNMSQTHQVGQQVKIADERLSAINNLMENAEAGRLLGNGQYKLTAVNDPTSLIQSLTLRGASQYDLKSALTSNISSSVMDLANRYESDLLDLNLSTSSDALQYKWTLQDTSQNPNSPTSNLPGKVPAGIRIYNATLTVYKKDSKNQPVVLNKLNTIIQVNDRKQQNTKLGVDILLDNSGSMMNQPDARFKDSLPTSMPQPSRSLYAGRLFAKYAAFGTQLTDTQPASGTPYPGAIVPGYPARGKNNNTPIASTTNWDAYRKSTLSYEIAGILNDEVNADIPHGALTFPYLVYRYKLPNQTNSNLYAKLYKIPTSELLDPFENSQIDLTFQAPSYYKSKQEGDGLHTYPGPGVLGISTNKNTNCTMTADKWFDQSENHSMRGIFPYTAVRGDFAGAINMPGTVEGGKGTAEQMTFRTWLTGGSKIPAYNFTYTQTYGTDLAGKPNLISGNDIMANPSRYPLYNKMLDSPLPLIAIGSYPSLQAPTIDQDYRTDIHNVCSQDWSKLNSDTFENYKNAHLFPVEAARNALLRFLLNIEGQAVAGQPFTEYAEIGLHPFSPGAVGGVKIGPATSDYSQVKLFEKLRLFILGINRYGSDQMGLFGNADTPTFRALKASVKSLTANNYSSRAILMITDGRPHDNDQPNETAEYITQQIKATSGDDALNLKGNRIPLFVIGITNSQPDDMEQSDRDQMKAWADNSWGGTAVFTASDKELQAAIDQMVNLVNRQAEMAVIDGYCYDPTSDCKTEQ